MKSIIFVFIFKQLNPNNNLKKKNPADLPQKITHKIGFKYYFDL